MKIPKKVTVRLGPARRMYVNRLLARGLHGNSAAEVADIIFCRGLEVCVPPDWMREAAQRAARRERRK
jgi:hypothetical protein